MSTALRVLTKDNASYPCYQVKRLLFLVITNWYDTVLLGTTTVAHGRRRNIITHRELSFPITIHSLCPVLNDRTSSFSATKPTGGGFPGGWLPDTRLDSAAGTSPTQSPHSDPPPHRTMGPELKLA